MRRRGNTVTLVAAAVLIAYLAIEANASSSGARSTRGFGRMDRATRGALDGYGYFMRSARAANSGRVRMARTPMPARLTRASDAFAVRMKKSAETSQDYFGPEQQQDNSEWEQGQWQGEIEELMEKICTGYDLYMRRE